MSLTARLLLVVEVVVLVALLTASFVIYAVNQNFLYMQTDNQLESASTSIASILNRTGHISTFELSRIAPGMFVEVINAAGVAQTPLVYAYQPGITSTFTPNLAKNIYLPNSLNKLRFFNVGAIESPNTTFRVSTEELLNGQYLVVAMPINALKSSLDNLITTEVAVDVSVLLGSFLVGFFLLKLGMKPLSGIRDHAKAINSGNLSKRLPVASSQTEIGELSNALNHMLDEIEAAFLEKESSACALRAQQDATKNFIADASHELRTPLSAAMAYGELAQKTLDRDLNEAKEFLARLLKEMQRMKSLIDDLILLARFDVGKALNLENVDLVEIIKEAAESSLALGTKWPVKLELEDSCFIKGDGLRLRQVFDNLFSNVRNYCPENTRILIQLKKVNENKVKVVFEDNGPGFDKQYELKIFNRFFTVESSRAKSNGGVGLGLAIVAAIIRAHGGEIKAKVNEPVGLSFEIILPIEPVDEPV